MDRNKLIEKYFKDRQATDRHVGGYPFVTVSRQAGAGGHALGEAILAAMELHGHSDLFNGWKLIDRELCEDVSKEPDLHVSMMSLVTEEYHSEIEDFVRQVISKETPQVTIYERLFQIERTLASIGKVILVGRGSSLVTRDLFPGIRVRLTAPKEVRIERMTNLLDLDRHEAEMAVTKHDRERAHFVKDLFNRDVDDRTLYDRMWDTSVTPMAEIAEEVIGIIRIKGQQLGRK